VRSAALSKNPMISLFLIVNNLLKKYSLIRNVF